MKFFFGKEKEYGKIKYEHNEKMLHIEEEIQHSIEQSEDPLEQAILYARTGNYIDYGAMKVVDKGILGELLQKAAAEKLDKRNKTAISETSDFCTCPRQRSAK